MMMTDFRTRFATLDRAPVPDLWSDIERRAATLGSAGPVTSVTVRIPRQATSSGRRSLRSAAAVALLIALVAGAVAIGTGVTQVPETVPPSVEVPTVELSVAPSSALPSVTAEPSDAVFRGRSPWVAYIRDEQLWATRADGTGAHAVRSGSYAAVAWSRDGARLLLNDGRVFVAEVGEEFGRFIDTGVEVPVNEQWEAFDFAPDGVRVVFVQKSKCARGSSPTRTASSRVVLAGYIAETAGANCYALSVLDLRTSTVTALDETLVRDEQISSEGQGSLELPAWSPDGSKIAYTRIYEAERTGGGHELWIVNADGTDPARVRLESDVSVREPRWSPDGTQIAFTAVSDSQSISDSAVFVVELASGTLHRVAVASERGARRLCCTEWLDDSHLRVEEVGPEAGQFWLVTLGTASESRLLADLSSVGANLRTAPGDPGRTFFWQPILEGQP
jgi:hypothetical protein